MAIDPLKQQTILLVFLFILEGITTTSCRYGKQDPAVTEKQPLQQFFPVADFIQGEILTVDSLPIAMTRYDIYRGKTDTSYIQAAEFNRLAQHFQCEDLKPGTFEKEFSESTFIDKTTQAATFTYSARNRDQELQRVDVIAGTADATVKVTSVYLEKITHYGDTLELEKLLWRTQVSFTIFSSRQVGNRPPDERQLKVVWDKE